MESEVFAFPQQATQFVSVLRTLKSNLLLLLKFRT